MELTYFPIHDYGPVMKGMVIGGIGIFHVFLAQFAIGGGMVMTWLQWSAMRTDNAGLARDIRTFLDGYFKVLVLISFVVGALTGVAMWFTTIQVSPRTIGTMVDAFHWLWAVEWTFFSLEIVAGYVFYRYGPRLPDRTRLALLGLYAMASWFSLFWINGILSWQLTPGEWAGPADVWAGFFNPSFWPSLLFRTIVCLTLGALAVCVVANTMDIVAERRRDLIRRAAWLLTPMAIMPLLGAWFLGVIPEDSRGWVLGGSPTMTNFLAIAVGSSALIGLYALAMRFRKELTLNVATSALLVALAFGATAGGEFVREGVRKPYTVRNHLYSNAITPGEVARLRARGSVTDDPYPLIDAARYPNDQVRLGAKVFRFQCSVCHTQAGVNGLIHVAGSWTTEQKRLNFSHLQQTRGFMPPFAGNAQELEALVQFATWLAAGEPQTWPVSDDPAATKQIEEWLAESGTGAGGTH